MATCCLLLVRVGVAPAAPAKAVSEVTEEICGGALGKVVVGGGGGGGGDGGELREIGGGVVATEGGDVRCKESSASGSSGMGGVSVLEEVGKLIGIAKFETSLTGYFATFGMLDWLTKLTSVSGESAIRVELASLMSIQLVPESGEEEKKKIVSAKWRGVPH